MAWKKLLWVKQPYPDNYVDESFLSQLKRNTNVAPYHYWQLVADMAGIIVHLCSVAMFAVVFVGVYNEKWSPQSFVVGSSALTVGGFGLWAANNPGGVPFLERALKSSALIVFVVLALSPVLKSLTRSTSSDSIWALSCWLCVGNICFHDYSSVSAQEFKPILATNLALSAAIVLASRLESTLAVFSFVLFSIQLFGVFPSFVRWVYTTSRRGRWSLVATVVIATDVAIFALRGGSAVLLWTAVQVAVTFGLPGWLIELQKYKNEIQGPWDPAKPILRSDT
uniref:ARAD1D43890p n=1 Tax=Blastobotrys adeninivorans TaxID=409370 RepID=A0A060TJ41_BLAAD